MTSADTKKNVNVHEDASLTSSVSSCVPVLDVPFLRSVLRLEIRPCHELAVDTHLL